MRPLVWLTGVVLGGSLSFVPLFAPDGVSSIAAEGDRVGFPADYRTSLEPLRSSFKRAKNLVGTTYANPVAATVTDLAQQPYPYGSVFVFEWTEPVRDAAGTPVLEPDGQSQHGAVVRVDVMRREPGFGTKYEGDRGGEWEFASYRADGTAMAAEPELRQCAQCHGKAATRDYVFRGRFPPMGAP